MLKTVHPRARGEHGEPPKNKGFLYGFIPALAGNMPMNPADSGRSIDGSSPRSRGTFWPCSFTSTRFIPALAGNIDSTVPQSTVHPRARGEHSAFPGLVVLCYGSSPRSRGTYAIDQTPRLDRGSSPRSRGTCGWLAFSVYHCTLTTGSSPRSRGTFESETESNPVVGSSPRSRGT